MYKKLVLCLAVLFSALTGSAQKDVLKFSRDGKFKIVQFTDVHYKYDDQVNSQISLERINEVLDAEHPDFVIFTGDVVVSNETFKGLDIVLYLAIMMMSMTMHVPNFMIILPKRKVV